MITFKSHDDLRKLPPDDPARPVMEELVELLAYSTEACHPFHVKAATQTAAKLPPIGA